MKLKSLLLVASAAVTPALSFAAQYYVSPIGAGVKDGSTWENAFGVAEFRTQASSNTNGDVYYFQGGVYDISEGTVVFQVATGATLIGNTEGERTVFSGDKDGNNNPNEGDASRLIRFQANTVNGNSTNAIVIENIDFTGVFTMSDAADTNMSALAIDNSGDVVVKGCRFYNNWSQGTYGGPAAYIYRSTVKFIDCIFSNNSANYRGGAIRINSNDVNKGVVTMENCVVKNNTNYHNLGGAIFMSHGNSLNIVNSTISGNKAASDGAAIYFNGYDSAHHRALRIVNSTIANNISTTEDDAQIVSTNNAHLSLANSIIPSADATAAIKFKGDAVGADFQFVTGGYNYVGSVITPADTQMNWDSTDSYGDACSYTAIFGDNVLNAENVITPAIFILGATGAQVSEAVREWGMPADLDLTLDQLGNQRTSEMTPGAYAVKKEDIDVSAVSKISEEENPILLKIADGVYSIKDSTVPVMVYNLNGKLVMTAKAECIDLSSFTTGIYLLKAKNKVYKVIR